MSYAKLIHDYIDGGLDSTNEQTLFSMLSSNDEMRQEFNTQFKMHLAAQEEMSQIAPPLHVTNALFTGLGLALPSNYVQSPVAVFKKFLTRFSPAILLLFFFGAIGWGLLEYQNNQQLISELASLKTSGQNNIPLMSSFASDDSGINNTVAENQSNQFDAMNSDKSSPSPSNNRTSRRAINQYESSTNNTFDVTAQGISNNSTTKIQSGLSLFTINTSNPDLNYFDNNFTNKSNHFKNYKRFGSSLGSFGSEYHDKTMIGQTMIGTKHNFQIRRLDPTYVSPTFATSKLSEPNESYAISYFYSINDYHSIGIELAQENFTQTFTTKDGLNYSQSPEILMLGANYRFTPKNALIPYYLYPYAQQFAGVTTIGPVFKTQAGVIWQITSPISLHFGFEWGTLIYNVGGTLHNSNKFGTSGGISIGF